MHSKAVPRFVWVTGYAAAAAGSGFIGMVGMEVVRKTPSVNIPFTVVFAGNAVLPLLATTSRQFATFVQFYFPFWLLCLQACQLFEWTATGSGLAFWYQLPVNLSVVFLLTFRRSYFVMGFTTIFFVDHCLKNPLFCAIGSIEFNFEYDTLGECALRALYQEAIMIGGVGFMLLALLVRKLAILLAGRHAANTSRESHRHATHPQRVRVQASGLGSGIRVQG